MSKRTEEHAQPFHGMSPLHQSVRSNQHTRATTSKTSMTPSSLHQASVPPMLPLGRPLGRPFGVLIDLPLLQWNTVKTHVRLMTTIPTARLSFPLQKRRCNNLLMSSKIPRKRTYHLRPGESLRRSCAERPWRLRFLPSEPGRSHTEQTSTSHPESTADSGYG